MITYSKRRKSQQHKLYSLRCGPSVASATSFRRNHCTAGPVMKNVRCNTCAIYCKYHSNLSWSAIIMIYHVLFADVLGLLQSCLWTTMNHLQHIWITIVDRVLVCYHLLSSATFWSQSSSPTINHNMNIYEQLYANIHPLSTINYSQPLLSLLTIATAYDDLLLTITNPCFFHHRILSWNPLFSTKFLGCGPL